MEHRLNEEHKQKAEVVMKETRSISASSKATETSSSSSSSSTSTTTTTTTTATTQQQRSWGLWSIATGAVSGVWWVASSVFGYFWNAASAAGSGRREHERFVSSFEARYGTTHPAFFAGTFLEAAAFARSRFQLLVVYLHSEMHGDTPQFCSATLCSPAVVAFLGERFVVWAGDVREKEGFAISNALRASEFPFVGVILANTHNGRPGVIATLPGLRDSSEFVAALVSIADGQGATLLDQARDHDHRETESRALREQQHAAFQQSLQADQEKDRRRLEDERRRCQELEAAERARAERRAKLPAVEPPEGKGAITVAVRLPGGQRIKRRFSCDDSLQTVFAFVDGSMPGGADADQTYSLCTNFPRTSFSYADAAGVRVSSLGDQALMYVLEDSPPSAAAAAAAPPGRQ